jgi:Carboxypeptidase regulatory-like domain
MGKTYKRLLLSLMIVPIALCVKADEHVGGTDRSVPEGILHGYVTDAVTKKPLSGVTVSAIVPGTNNPKEVLTDADGYFRFTRLPVSQVTVQFDKKGYQSTKRPNVAIKERNAVKLNVEFQPEEAGADSDNSEYPLLRMLQAS